MLNAVLLTLIPAGAVIAGALLGFVWRPGATIRSAVQHFTAGVVMAAVGAELLPELGSAHPLGIAIGFTLGGALMLAIKRWIGEEGPQEAPDDQPGGKNTGLLVTVGVDLFIDGLLCAVALAAAPDSGLVIVAALTLEVFFLGLATSVSLSRPGSGAGGVMKAGALAVLVPIGGASGALAFLSLPALWQVGILAFATAALIYLVTEELLAEAHADGEDTTFVAATFFLGFLAVLMLKALSG
ncbi:ZIP family metal transporter [Roseixanthobacter glucoisosaccharinicivorans]|uniref:ZIP family metal transporter n=1 Tax=Roseixanthobacter glucoisosaccharinicivorans TaxID=3119923 RepID=UPI00372835A2